MFSGGENGKVFRGPSLNTQKMQQDQQTRTFFFLAKLFQCLFQAVFTYLLEHSSVNGNKEMKVDKGNKDVKMVIRM